MESAAVGNARIHLGTLGIGCVPERTLEVDENDDERGIEAL